MPRPRSRAGSRPAAEALARTAPLVSRWIERLLAAHDPPLTVAQYLVLQAVGEGELVGSELARRAAVSPAAVSQLLAALEDGNLLERRRLADDRRRQPLSRTGRRPWRSLPPHGPRKERSTSSSTPPAWCKPERRRSVRGSST